METKLLNYLLTGEPYGPSKTDYNFYPGYKEKVFIDGELKEIRIWKGFNGVSYNTLAVKETISYIRNASGYVMYRTNNVEWYLEDGSIGVSQSGMKIYNFVSSMEEGVTRRSNRIDFLKADLIGKLTSIQGYSLTAAEAEAKSLLSEQASNIGLYKEGDTGPLLNGLSISTIPLLSYFDAVSGLDLRVYCISKL
jgi:hypothetical protein